jgi:DNA-binding transcriptional LysR family regulator
MFDRFEAMSVLVAAVETGSFSAAGRKLGMPLPTVSRKISELEAHLQTRLLVRTTRKLALTEAGSAFLAATRRILEQLGDAERAASGEYVSPRGSLVLTAPWAFGRLHVLPIVAEFLVAYPDIRVQVVLSDRNAHILHEQVDVAVRIGSLPDSSLVGTRVGNVTRIACASPGFLDAHGEPSQPADLVPLPCVTYDGLADGSAWSFAGGGKAADQSIRIEPRLAVNSAEAAVDAAILGVGVTQVLSYQAALAIGAGLLKRILVKFEKPAMPVSLLHAGQGLLPLKTRSFLEFAAPRLRKAIAPAE